MLKKGYSGIEKFTVFIYLFILLFLVWLALTSSLNPQKLGAGILIAFFLSSFLSATYIGTGLPPLGIKRFVYIFFFLFVLFKEIVKANLDVAYRVIHPQMPIKPGIVIIKTNLKQDIAKVILANSITLTPGTFTLDIQGDSLLIHWIYVRSDDPEERTRIIGQKFEKILKVIFD